MTDYETLRRLATDMADELTDYAMEALRSGSEPSERTINLLHQWRQATTGRRAAPCLGDLYVSPTGLVQEVRAIIPIQGVVMGWGEGEDSAGQCVSWDELERLWRPLESGGRGDWVS